MHVATEIVTPATTYPVTLTEVRSHGRITETIEDDRISNIFIPAATEYVQGYTKRQLMQATLRLNLSRWPSNGVIQVPNPPLASVTSVIYVDTNGTQQTIDSSDYQVDTASTLGRVAPARGETWPSIDDEAFNPVRVLYVAGYASSALVPATIKLAILTLCVHWFDRRGIDGPLSVDGPLKHSLDAMLWKEKIEPPNYEDC